MLQRSEDLVVRFIERSRRYRRGGAWAGILVAVLVSVIAEAEGTPLIGSGGVDLAVLFAIGLGGSVAGSVVAEAFRFRPRRGARTASLDVRDLSAYDDPVTTARLVAVGTVAVVTAAVAVVIGAPVLALWLAPIALLAWLRWWATRRIALRSRPALPPELAAADDMVRLLAASAGLGRPVATLCLLLLHFQLAGLADASASIAEGGALEGSVGLSPLTVLAVVGSLVSLVLAVRWWWTNRSFGIGAPRARRSTTAVVLQVAAVVAIVALPILAVVAARG